MPLLPNRANTEENKDGMDDRSPIPAGDYPMHIVKTEFKPTKAKTGHYLACQLKVLDGEYKGRVVFLNLNLDNPNPVAVEIANKELNSICQACGQEGVEDSDELLNIPMMVSVKINPGDANWPPSNETTGYKSMDEVSEMVDPSAEPEGVPSDTPADNAGEESKVDGGAPAKLPWE